MKQPPAVKRMPETTYILHTEVGGNYGGSVKALETFLKYSDRQHLSHDVLFHREPPQAETLHSLAHRVIALEPLAAHGPRAAAGTNHSVSSLRALARPLVRTRPTQQAIEIASFLRSLPIANRIRQAIIQNGYDAVHVNNTFTYGAAGIIAGRLAGRPVVAHVRNPINPTPFSRWLASKASCIVCVNQGSAAALLAAGVRRPVRTVSDAVEPEKPSPHQVAKVRGELLPKGGILIGAVGRLDRQKDYDNLIEAAAIIHRKRRDAHFAIAGEGPLRPNLQGIIERLGLRNVCTLAGFQADTSAFTAALDIFVCSSLWEGGPLSLVEAALLERPIASTSVGVVPEIILPGRGGLLVEPGAPAALADAIDAIAEMEPDQRHRLGLAARHSAQRFTDVKGLAEQLDAILVESTRSAL